MKVEFLELNNFRGIPRLRLDFPARVNVFAGVNGAGKTSILDCAAILLSRMVARIRADRGAGRPVLDSDISNGFPDASAEISVSLQGKGYRWSVSKARRGRIKRRGAKLGPLAELAGMLRSNLTADERASLPLVVWYPVNRAVLDIPLRIRKRHPFDQLSAYDRGLAGGSSNFRLFFEWFREREDIENERRVRESSFRDRQLDAVRRAISEFVPGFYDLRVKRSPLRMVVRKDGGELSVDQLSDGEKCALAMAGDLARRLALANPASHDPLGGAGVVLVDEIDLHLHPGWQRQIVGALRRAFPNCQFLLSTHSPQILSHLRPRNIWMLERTDSGVTASRPSEAYGRETSRILEDLMKVPDRPDDVEARLSCLFRTIGRMDFPTATRQLAELRADLGEDPDLVTAEVLIRRKEALGG